MKKYMILITLLSSGLVHHARAMDEHLASMAGLIDEDGDEARTEQKEERYYAFYFAREKRDKFAHMCLEDDYKGVKDYLESHTDPIPVQQYGISLIHYVTTARVAVLLERRRDITLDARDQYGSILHWANKINACTPMLLKYVIRRYCEEEKTLDINERRNIDGETVLHQWANGVAWSHPSDLPVVREKLQILLDAGADCTLKDNKGRLPLDLLEHELRGWVSRGDWKEKEASFQTLIDDLKKAMDARKKSGNWYMIIFHN